MVKRRQLILVTVGVTSSLAGCGNSTSDSSKNDNSSSNSSDAEIDDGQDNTAETDGEETDAEPEFDIISFDAPGQVEQPSETELQIEVENVSDVDGMFSQQIEISMSNQAVIRPNQRPVYVSAEVPAGERKSIKQEVDVTGSGFATFTVGELEREVMVIPESTSPIVETVELTERWEEFGDVSENAIESVRAGEVVGIGVRYQYWHADSGTLDVFVQTTTRNNSDKQVDVSKLTDERLIDRRGWQYWEHWVEIQTDGWKPGEYTTAVLIRDNRTDSVSEEKSVTYEIE